MATTTGSNPYPAIVCFGDSQTQFGYSLGGFVARLSDAYQRKADVINRGYSGYTTRDAVNLLPYVFGPPSGGEDVGGQQRILAVTVWLGCNDSIDEGQKQYVSEKDYEKNLTTILDAIKGAGKTASSASPFVLVMGPTPVLERANHRNERKTLYTSIARKVVDSRQDDRTQFLDTYELFTKNKRGLAALLQYDALHISPDGYEVLFDAIFTILQRQPGLDPLQMPMVFPDWKTLSSDVDEVKAQIVPSTSTR